MNEIDDDDEEKLTNIWFDEFDGISVEIQRNIKTSLKTELQNISERKHALYRFHLYSW